LLTTLWGKTVCFVKGKHKRGHLVRTDPPETEGVRYKFYACSRCGHERKYPV